MSNVSRTRGATAIAALGIFLAAPAFGSDVSAGGPDRAHFYDAASGSIRPLAGFAGAAIAGAPVLTGLDIASVAPGGRAAIARRDGAMYWIRDLGQSPVSQTLFGVSEGADKMAWSGNGACVVLYSSTSNWIQRICDSPAGAQAEPAMSFAGRLESIRAVSMDVRGERIAVAGADGTDAALYLVAAAQADRLLIRTASIGALAFRRNGSILFANDSDGAIFELAAAAYAGAETVAAPGATSKPMALIEAESGDIIVLEEEGRSLAVFSRSGDKPARRETLDAPAAGLQRVYPNTYIATRNTGSGPLLLIDATRAELVFFVPEN